MEVATGVEAGRFLEGYEVDPGRGFLPVPDPLTSLPEGYGAWDQAGAELPKLLAAGRAGRALDELPMLDADGLGTRAELERAVLVLSYLAHAYVFETSPPRGRVPAQIAVPWHAIAVRLGRPPVLSYFSHNLSNWRRFDGSEPVELGNLARVQNFLGGMDDDWFILVHVAIEAVAGPGIAAVAAAQDAVAAGDDAGFAAALERVGRTLREMVAVLGRMPERCDPYVYYTRVRPWMFGSKDNPALPEGLVYEGVEEYGGRPQQFRGETGAQSTIVPALDRALGIRYVDNALEPFLLSFHEYMPPRHRAFVGALGERPSIRAFAERAARSGDLRTRDAYNDCITEMVGFRRTHIRYASEYIHQQSQRDAANSSDTGTGGTPFMRYLAHHINSVETFRLA